MCCTYTFCHYLFFSISLFEISLVTLLHSLGDLHCDYDTSSVNYGTPSHLSIGTSSLNTATWTEEAQPSFTDSSISGSLGRASADPGQFLSVAAVIDLFLHKKKSQFTWPENLKIMKKSSTKSKKFMKYGIFSIFESKNNIWKIFQKRKKNY